MRSELRGAATARIGRSSIDGRHTPHLGHVVLEIAFDSMLERDARRRAPDAGAVEADAHDILLGDVHELDVPAVGLHGRAHEFDDAMDAPHQVIGVLGCRSHGHWREV